MLNIEGLGRELDPELDIWKTAKPYLESWMKEQVGWRGLLERFKAEAPRFSHILPQLPRLVHQALTAQVEQPHQENAELLRRLIAEQERTNLLLSVAVYFAGGLAGGFALMQLYQHWDFIVGMMSHIQ